jgi:hypothetical protein
MTTRTAVLGAILVAALAVLVLVILWQPAEEAPAPSSDRLKVVVVGVDGLDWFILQKYMSEGRMPFVGRLVGRSVLGSVAADRPVLPTVGWTQLGNGKRLTDEALTTLGDMRGRSMHTGVPALAGAVVASGGTCLTVGWPGTWPLVESRDFGTVLAPYGPDAPTHELALAPALFEGGISQALPADLEARIDRTLHAGIEEWLDDFDNDILPPGSEPEGWSENVMAARWSYTSDRTTLDLAAELLAELEPDLALIQLGGLDAVSHRFVAPGMREYFPGLPDDVAARYADVLPSYYEFLDSAISRIHRLTDDHTVFLLCSTYGTHPLEGDFRISGSHERGAPGVFVLSGPKVAPVPVPIELSTIDVAPTLLAVLGRQIPTDLDGRIVMEATPGGLLETYPPVYSTTSAADAPAPSMCATDAMEALAAARGRLIAER